MLNLSTLRQWKRFNEYFALRALPKFQTDSCARHTSRSDNFGSPLSATRTFSGHAKYPTRASYKKSCGSARVAGATNGCHTAIPDPSEIVSLEAFHFARKPRPMPSLPGLHQAFLITPSPPLGERKDPGQPQGRAIYPTPDVGDVAKPDLVGRLDIKLPVQDIEPIKRALAGPFLYS